MNRDRVIGVALLLTAALAVIAMGALTGNVSTGILTALGVAVVGAAAGFFGERLMRRR